MQIFLSTYGTWILLGLSILVMYRMHAGHGMSHGGSHSSDQPQNGGREMTTKSDQPETTAGAPHRHSGC